MTRFSFYGYFLVLICVLLRFNGIFGASRQSKCREEECSVPRCVDPVYDKYGCCKICPRGGNCWSKGEVIDAVNQNLIRSAGSGCYALCRCPGSHVYRKHGADTTASCRFWCSGGGSAYANILKKAYSSWGKR